MDKMEWKSKNELNKINEERNAKQLIEANIKNILAQLNEKHPIKAPLSEIIIERLKKSISFDSKMVGFILEMMKIMSLNNCRVKLMHYTNELKFPSDKAAAFVNLPLDNMPFFGTPEFNKLTIPIHFRQSIIYPHEGFIYTMAHELSHIVLHSTRNPLRHSEKATDLFVILSGFGQVMKDGRIQYFRGVSEDGKSLNKHLGYLDDTEFHFAIKYADELRKKNIMSLDNLLRNDF